MLHWLVTRKQNAEQVGMHNHPLKNSEKRRGVACDNWRSNPRYFQIILPSEWLNFQKRITIQLFPVDDVDRQHLERIDMFHTIPGKWLSSCATDDDKNYT